MLARGSRGKLVKIQRLTLSSEKGEEQRMNVRKKSNVYAEKRGEGRQEKAVVEGEGW